MIQNHFNMPLIWPNGNCLGTKNNSIRKNSAMQLFHLSISEDIDNQISGCQKISSTQCSPSAWAAAAKWKTTFFFTPILP
jgi:hypothetical protein